MIVKITPRFISPSYQRMLAADKDGKQIFEGVLPYNIKKILDNKAYAYFEVEMKSGKIKISKEVNDNFLMNLRT